MIDYLIILLIAQVIDNGLKCGFDTDAHTAIQVFTVCWLDCLTGMLDCCLTELLDSVFDSKAALSVGQDIWFRCLSRMLD